MRGGPGKKVGAPIESIRCVPCSPPWIDLSVWSFWIRPAPGAPRGRYDWIRLPEENCPIELRDGERAA